MSSKNSNISSSKVGRSRARYPTDDGLTPKISSKGSLVDTESDLKPVLNAKVERLQRENARLKEELEDWRVQYHQLLEEEKEEVFEKRRVNLLKAQVMQLERQVVLLSEGLSSQMSRCVEVEKALEPLTERLRSLLSVDSPSAEVSIARAKLTQLIEMCADVRQKLHRNNTVKTVENLSMPWILPKRNLVREPITLLDLCYGKTDNLNLQHVSTLESQLSQLFKHLQGMRLSLGLLLAPGPPPPDPAGPARPTPQAQRLLPHAVYARLLNQATHCSRTLDHCCPDLLTLSLILPSTPWPSEQQQQVTQALSAQAVLSVLPSFPRGPSPGPGAAALIARQQVEALEAELDFHRSLYSLQVQHAEGLLTAIRQAYRAFQDNVSQTLCSPLQDVLSCYEALKSCASEPALRAFLTAFKASAPQIQEAVEALDPAKNQGEEALSQYGREFFLSLEELQRRCEEQRERSAAELQLHRQEEEEVQESLRALRRRKSEEEAANLSERGRGQACETSAVPPKLSSPETPPLANPPSPANSRTGLSKQPRVTQRPTNHRLGKSPPGRKSMNPRPEWQS
ncbi:hypothetical protein COCON_G00155360 [Conger conger]|uniref:Uncharacterized protein n=1 Tax=Conger conger TaxID=82655 RepID=A0A9Q1HU89_CONCO|nr:hypothetical protein COCON_G00155360 [Conger conger]